MAVPTASTTSVAVSSRRRLAIRSPSPSSHSWPKYAKPPVATAPYSLTAQKAGQEDAVATLVTTAVPASRRRMRSWSEIHTVVPPTAMPRRSLKRAAEPVPSALPDIPALPATVVTAPLASVRRRIVWLPRSLTHRSPPARLSPYGWLKSAAAPVPSVLPETPAVPAIVVTAPVAITTRRIVWLPESAT